MMVPSYTYCSHMTDGDDRSSGGVGGDFSCAVFVHTCRRLLPQVITITTRRHYRHRRRRHLVRYIFKTTMVIPVARSRYPELCSTTGRPVETVHTCPAKQYADFLFFIMFPAYLKKHNTFFYMGRRIKNNVSSMHCQFSIFFVHQVYTLVFFSCT